VVGAEGPRLLRIAGNSGDGALDTPDLSRLLLGGTKTRRRVVVSCAPVLRLHVEDCRIEARAVPRDGKGRTVATDEEQEPRPSVLLRDRSGTVRDIAR
jgi:hypothetical protein